MPRLLEAGRRVRVLVRDPARLQGRDWAARVETSAGDVLRPETLAPALRGVFSGMIAALAAVAGRSAVPAGG